jgi:hypothetical protein
MRLFRVPLLCCFLLFASVGLSGQGPDASWQTIETENFRFHFPAEYEQWTRQAAGKMETIRERLIAEIGFQPGGKVDVLVMNPLADANASAWPFLSGARMILWTNPPGPETTLGNFSSWIDVVAVHEDAHLVHLLRPSRNPLQRLLARALPVGPVGLRSPRWVSEGYATVLEGDLTGSGRPNSDFRASILRRWAQLGRLPSYSQLRSDSDNWLGMSMAYLVGSSYLEWLRAREGPDSLRNLWARLTGRFPREFDEAFVGVFGGTPGKMYDRYTAELTHAAIEIENLRKPTLREGDLWQDLEWSTEQPAVAPRGDRLVTVLRDRDDPPQLVILSTGPDDRERKRREERIDRIIARDPQDVRPVDRTPLDREPLFRLRGRDRSEDFHSPRWFNDGQSILFSRMEPDSDGVLHPDLFRWQFERGEVVRLTRVADVRDADPSPDGSWAVAVRNRFGLSQLVRVELTTGKVVDITEPSVDVVFDHPRISPDGSQIAYLRHQNARWNLVVRSVAGGEERSLPIPDAGVVAQPEWSGDGSAIFVSASRGGFIEIVQVPLDGAPPIEITRTNGAAFGPAPSPTGDALFFLVLDVDGFNIHRMDVAALADPLPPFVLDRDRWPLAGVRTGAPTLIPVSDVGPARPYGTGRQELSVIVGGNRAPSSDMLEFGLRSGDVVGRLDVLALGAAGDRGVSGAAAAAAWRGWPVEVSAHLFTADEALESSAEPHLLTERTGVELRGDWKREWRNALLGVGAGGFAGRADDRDEQIVFATVGLDGERPRRGRLLAGALDASVHYGSRGSSDWTRTQARAGAGIGVGDTAAWIAWGRGFSSGDPGEAPFALGGVRSSITPDSVGSGRIFEPALEAATLIGTDYEEASVDLRISDLPIAPFFHRYRVWSDGDSRPEWLELAGLRAVISADALPVLQLPAFELQLGVARVLDDALDDATRWWIGLTWRP